MIKTVPGLLSIEECTKLTGLVRRLPPNDGDESVPGSSSYYNLPCMNIVLGRLEASISSILNLNLKSTYTYTRVYKHGDVLKRHVDRPSCEWSVTVNLSQSDPWPIFMGGDPVVHGVGDGTIYQGCDVEHWREPFTGSEYIQVFLHYVDARGPNADYEYDAQYEPTLYFPIRNLNKTLCEVWRKPRVFSYEECDTLISQFKSKIEKARVGEGGALNNTLRNNKVTWIPKTKANEWIYHRCIDLVTEANSNLFHVDLSEIFEEIQFTVYDTGEHYDWHVDLGLKNYTGLRKLSISVQLSDPGDYDGGRLEFDHYTESDIRQGTAVVFPSFIRHRVTPVTRGTRYALVCWVSGHSFR